MVHFIVQLFISVLWRNLLSVALHNWSSVALLHIICCSAGVAFVVRNPNDPGTSSEEFSRGSKTGYTTWPIYTIDTQEYLVFGEF